MLGLSLGAMPPELLPVSLVWVEPVLPAEVGEELVELAPVHVPSLLVGGRGGQLVLECGNRADLYTVWPHEHRKLVHGASYL